MQGWRLFAADKCADNQFMPGRAARMHSEAGRQAGGAMLSY